MIVKNLSIDLESLKEHHYIFSLVHSNALKSECNTNNYPFEITFYHSQAQLGRLESLFKNVLLQLKIEKNYQELLAFYPILQECFYENDVRLSSEFNGIEYLNYLIKLLEFQQNSSKENLSIEISSCSIGEKGSSHLSLKVPQISDLNVFLFDKLIEESLKNAKYASFSLRMWLNSIPDYTLESFKKLKNTIPKVYNPNPSLNEQVAYASHILIGYLNQIGLKKSSV